MIQGPGTALTEQEGRQEKVAVTRFSAQTGSESLTLKVVSQWSCPVSPPPGPAAGRWTLECLALSFRDGTRPARALMVDGLTGGGL